MRRENFVEDIDLVANRNIKEREYWLKKLSGEPRKSNFPYDFIHRKKSGDVFDTVKFAFNEQDSNLLLKLSSGSDYTLHIILCAIVAALMTRYTAMEDIIIGTPIYKQDISGDFINTVLPLRCLFADDMTFKDILLQLRKTILEATEHQNYPIEALLFQLNMKPPTPGEDFPLFDTVVLLENVQDPGYFRHIRCNMVFSFLRAQQSIEATVTFNPSLFKKTTVDIITSHLLNWFHEAATHLDSPLANIQMLSSTEIELLTAGFNKVEKEFPQEKTIHRLIEENADKSPDRIAVQYNNTRLSYRLLNQLANCLGHTLAAESNFAAGGLVGILMERSEKMVISILATWKCGGAYIPLEVNDPVERIKTIIEDSGIKILIGDDKAILNRMAECSNGVINTIYLGPDYHIQIASRTTSAKTNLATTPSSITPSHLNITATPRDMAYIIYTSGSTGKPKGAIIEQVGMTNHILAKINDLNLDEDCVIAQNASHCFDISIWQFFAALCAGGKIVIYDKDVILDPLTFINAIDSHAVSILEVIPSYLTILLGILEQTGHEKQALFPNLKFLIATGETLKPALVRRWFNLLPHVKLMNAYGPTEASDDITHYIMDKTPHYERIPIGKSIQNLRIYIVDKHMNLCPVGVKGEICVAGIGVGKGYLNDYEKTTAVFVTSPFAPSPSTQFKRLYKTGDTGCWLPDGNIDFFGRKDFQVKVRGFRIELGEIENVLTSFNQVKEAVVLYLETTDIDVSLAAYIIPFTTLNIEELRSYLTNILPDYMVPSYILQLEEFPLTPHGKIDRKALRTLPLSSSNLGGKTTYAEPTNDIEKKLVKIWQDVLEVERVGIKDEFFQLGGDSFKAISVVSKFGKGFLVPDIYRNTTIEKLARYVAEHGEKSQELLYELTNTTQKKTISIIGVSNSGGDPLSFRDTADQLSTLTDSYALYAVALPRTPLKDGESMNTVLFDLANQIVLEIKKKINTPVILYGQCNGTGLILQLARLLENIDYPVAAICMGSSLARLQRTPDAQELSDNNILTMLDELGGDYPKDITEQLFFFNNFRYDSNLAGASYNNLLTLLKNKNFKKFNTPLFCITGSQDPLTKKYLKRYKDWKRFANNVQLIEIKNAGHMLLKDNPQDVARILFELGHKSNGSL